jgi:hypothetical protein
MAIEFGSVTFSLSCSYFCNHASIIVKSPDCVGQSQTQVSCLGSMGLILGNPQPMTPQAPGPLV